MNAAPDSLEFPSMDLWVPQPPLIGPGIDTMPGVGPSIDDVEAEMVGMPHLACDLITIGDDGTRHECRDARGVRTPAEHLPRLPGPREALHQITSGRHALWDIVPVIAALAAPHPIEALHIATLGFSRSNIAEMLDMLDAGTIRQLTLVCSHYFKSTSGGIWEFAAAEFKRRPAARFLSIRTHAKIIAACMGDGRAVTIEASANLRSCKNIEQMTFFGHPRIYAFHTRWIDSLFTGAMQ
jgi:hypothetical protein